MNEDERGRTEVNGGKRRITEVVEGNGGKRR